MSSLDKYFRASGSLPLADPKHKWVVIAMETGFAGMIAVLFLSMPHTARAMLYTVPMTLAVAFFGFLIWQEYAHLAPYYLEWNETSLTIHGMHSRREVRWRDIKAVERVQPYSAFNVRLSIRLVLEDGSQVDFPLPYAFPLRAVLVHYLAEKLPPRLWPS